MPKKRALAKTREALEKAQHRQKGEALTKTKQRLKRGHTDQTPWKCTYCGYSPTNDDQHKGKCPNCGRNFIGESLGDPPAREERDRRPGILH